MAMIAGVSRPQAHHCVNDASNGARQSAAASVGSAKTTPMQVQNSAAAGMRQRSWRPVFFISRRLFQHSRSQHGNASLARIGRIADRRDAPALGALDQLPRFAAAILLFSIDEKDEVEVHR